ncbi:hypothetical protein [Roseicyclus marinus]|uniref:hypothetical protein n=1 Tax=Roseicyclus marinus TaxID=2161673 RepID=UPI00240EAB45|nr:hypothetical protein [Roseicyclus marinus]MDG3040456.1 hypothetical protein [Roseicyclus marinus]
MLELIGAVVVFLGGAVLAFYAGFLTIVLQPGRGLEDITTALGAGAACAVIWLVCMGVVL